MSVIQHIVFIWISLYIVESKYMCFVGDDVESYLDLDTVTVCADDEVCSLEQYSANVTSLRYRVGCVNQSLCNQSIVTTSSSACHECCENDVCNDRLCNFTGFDNSQGPLCYDCPGSVPDPRQCRQFRQCAQNEICGIFRDTDMDFRLGCMEDNTCQQQRDSSSCVECCSSDFCNFDCHSTLYTTPHACIDDVSYCETLINSSVLGHDACNDSLISQLCKYTCDLCPTTTVMTSPTTTSSTTTSSRTTPFLFLASSNTTCTDGVSYCETLINSSSLDHDACNDSIISQVCKYTCDLCPPTPVMTSPTTTPIPFLPWRTTNKISIVAQPVATEAPVTTTEIVTSSGPNTPHTFPPGSCYDITDCDALAKGLANAGKFLCDEPVYRLYCNETCGFCSTVAPSGCLDAPTCPKFVDTFNSFNMSVCVDGTFKYFCNDTCGICAPISPTIADLCEPHPCEHGTCTMEANNFKCTCELGYVGERCERVDNCLSVPCLHNGHCVNVLNDEIVCICNENYTGDFCEREVNPCSGNRCGNHGVCIQTADGYRCDCDRGYGGRHCNVEIKDCSDVLHYNIESSTHDELFLALVSGTLVNLNCDMTTAGGGWTVLMRRRDNHTNFYSRDSTDYAVGFGNLRRNFWLGLEIMHGLTNNDRRYKLRIDIIDSNGNSYHASYDDFHIGAHKEFVLHVGKYHGNAGDSLSGHNGFPFSTSDVDNDSKTDGSCANYVKGAWWFHDCFDSCLTCPYKTPGTEDCQSMSWNSHHYCRALRSAQMMIRPM